MSHAQAFTAAFVTSMQFIQPTSQSIAQSFTGAFPAIRLVFPLLYGGASGYIEPPAPRWSVSQRRNTSSTYHHHAECCTGQHSCPIIIMYIRVQGCATCYSSMPDSAAYRRPCQPCGVSMLPTPSGLQSGTLHPVEHSSSRRHGGRRGTIGGLPPLLFSGFRPIANRGQP